ncbi:MAG: CocE/NonD family hydrolase [Armatimonadota bacterium]
MASPTGVLGVIEEKEVPVVVRDGTTLRANIFRPDAPGQFPAIVIRTPYGKAGLSQQIMTLVRAGFVVMSQDTRGRHGSDGKYIPYTVENTGDAEDGYDTIEWMADREYCDGSVGVHGVSYPGWMSWQTASTQPPHLKGLCACSIPQENYEVDWPGAFKPARRIKWWLTTIAPDLRRRAGWPPPHDKVKAREFFDEYESGKWMSLVPWIDIVKYLPPGLAEYAEDWLKHPDRRSWKLDEIYPQIQVPNLDFSGWYDHCGGTMQHLRGMQQDGGTQIAREQSKLILGPWKHAGNAPRKTGEVDFGPQAELDRTDLMIQWFDHWLKDIDNDVEDWPAVQYFVMGSRRWKPEETWPPQDRPKREYYLSSNGRANPVEDSGFLGAGPGGEEPDTYRYDPRDPVPTLWTPAFFTVPPNRRKLEHRRDILYYRTEPLQEDVEIVGYPEVILYAATSAKDTDFFVRLVDERPDDIALEVCYGMVRARHRKSIHQTDFIEPGEVTEYHIQLGATACRFKTGHRIRLEITSSDFPNHDRNHNTGGNDLMETEMVPATQRIFHSEEYPSRLIVDLNE